MHAVNVHVLTEYRSLGAVLYSEKTFRINMELEPFVLQHLVRFWLGNKLECSTIPHCHLRFANIA